MGSVYSADLYVVSCTNQSEPVALKVTTVLISDQTEPTKCFFLYLNPYQVVDSFSEDEIDMQVTPSVTPPLEHTIPPTPGAEVDYYCVKR